MNIIIPTLGSNRGFKIPRYLIKINNIYLIQHIVKKLNFGVNFIFIISYADKIKFDSDKILKKINPNCKIVITKKKTKGILQTLLLAKKYINENPLIISNCDQFFNLDKIKLFKIIKNKNNFGCILTYSPKSKNHCFLKIKGNYVYFAAERKKISNIAAAGIYYIKNGLNFLKYVNRVIKKRITYNHMYYISSTFNEMIHDNKKIIHMKLKHMSPLGSPGELKQFIKKKNLKNSDFLDIF